MQNWKKILSILFWSIAAIALVVLFVFAWQAKGQKKCADIQVELVGENTRALFMNEQEILHILNQQQVKVGQPITRFNLVAIEKYLEQTGWIKNAELYLDNQLVLQVKIEQRIPIARVFSLGGSSFYIDEDGRRLPLRQLAVMRLPVFTGFTSDNELLSPPDSALLKSIVLFANTIKNDSFYTAQIAQVNIESNGDFELVPTLGDHVVLLGTIENLEDKLNRLYTFYKKVWVSSGINAFQVLDVRFDHQIVTLKKGMSPIQYAPGTMLPFQYLSDRSDSVDQKMEIPHLDTLKKSPLKKDTVIKTAAKVIDKKDKLLVNNLPNKLPGKIPSKIPGKIPVTIPSKTPGKSINKLPNKSTKKLNNKVNNKTLIKAKKTAKALMPKKSDSKTTN
jgi:cell division protein FtsQ